MTHRQRTSIVGVRELRQNLSVYLDRVKKGEPLTVTEHGVAVAILRPLPKTSDDVCARLVAEGRAIAPTRSLRDLPRPIAAKPGQPISDILDELRAERL